MKYFFRVIAVILFVLFFGFALKNTQEVALRFFLDYELRGPLVLLLLGFFIGGASLGVLAMMPTLFRYRRDLSKQKKAKQSLEKDRAEQRQASALPPQPDSILNK